jgi:hypothetical protein
VLYEVDGQVSTPTNFISKIRGVGYLGSAKGGTHIEEDGGEI